MSGNIKSFLLTLQKITNLQTPSTDVSRILLNFQQEMKACFFSAVPKENIISTFQKIWQIFFESYSVQTTSTKLLISRDVGFFLLRITPFYPDEMSVSFAQGLRAVAFNISSAPLVIASFSYITKAISPPLLSNSINSIPILQEFSSEQENISEYIAPIIPTLKHTGVVFFKRLFNFLIGDISPYPNRNITRMMSEVIMLNPSDFIQESINILAKDNIRGYLSIYSFMFLSNDIDLGEIDMSPLVAASFLVFKDLNSNKDDDNDTIKRKYPKSQEIDDALQILGVLPNLSVNITGKRCTFSLINAKLSDININKNNKPKNAKEKDGNNENNEKTENNVNIENRESNDYSNDCVDGDSNKNDIINDDIKNDDEKNDEENNDDENNDDENNDDEKNDDKKNLENCDFYVEIDLSVVENRSSFYRLSLPFEYLIPNKTDSILVATSKYKALTKYVQNNKYKSKILEIFNEVLSREYGDAVSLALQSISQCLEYITIDNLVLRHLFFSPMSSWFQSTDVLKVIEALKICDIEMGFASEIVDLLIEFALSRNTKLSEHASNVIIKFTHKTNCKDVIRKIINKCMFFQKYKMIKLLPILTKTYDNCNENEEDLSEFDWFVDSMIEYCDYYVYKFALSPYIYDFLVSSVKDSKKKKTPSFERIIKKAYIIIYFSYEIVTGKKWPNLQLEFQSEEEKNSIRSRLQSYIEINNFDIISDIHCELKNVLKPLFSTVKFVFFADSSSNLLEANLRICKKMFSFFPLIISRYMEKNWGSYKNASNFIKNIHKKLKYIGDLKVHAIWCRLSLQHIEAEETISFLNIIASHFLGQQKSDNLKLAAEFSIFILATFYEGKAGVIRYLANYSTEQFEAILFYAMKNKNSRLLLDLYSFENQPRNPQKAKVIESFKKPNLEINNTNKDPKDLLCQAINSGDLNNVQKVLDYLLQKGIKVPIIAQKINENISKYIINWMVKNQLPSFSIEECLEKLGTEWKPVALEIIKRDPESLLIYLTQSEKVKKKYVLNICSIIGFVEFDGICISNVAFILLCASKTTKQIRACLRLMTNLLLKYGIKEPQFVNEFVKFMRDKFSVAPVQELSVCTQTICKIIAPTDEMRAYINKLKKYVMVTCPILGNLQFTQLQYFTNSNNSSNDANQYALNEENLLVPFLNSSLPSFYLNGLRQFTQCTNSMLEANSERIMKAASSAMLTNLPNFFRLPFATKNCVKIFNILLSCERYQELVPNLCSCMSPLLFLPSISANFYFSRDWLPLAIKYSKSSDYTKRSLELFGGPLLNIRIFEIGIRCLKSRNSSIESSENQDSEIIDSIFTFTSAINEQDSVNTINFLFMLVDLIQNSHNRVISTAFIQFIKCVPRFEPVFLALLRFANHCEDRKMLKQLVEMLADLCECEWHRKAILFILDRSHIVDALKLAQISADSEKGAKALLSIS